MRRPPQRFRLPSPEAPSPASRPGSFARSARVALSLVLVVALGALVAAGGASRADELTDLLTPDAAGAPKEDTGSETGSIDVAASPVGDADIRRRLLGIYGALEALERLEVGVSSGIVTLGGTADSAAAAERAVEIASQVEGVVEVVDETAVDTDVGRRLRATLERLQGGAAAALAALPVFLLALGIVALFWWFGRRVAARRRLYRSLAPNGFIAELLGGIVRLLVVLLGVFLALSLLDATSIIGTVLGAAGIVGLAVGFAVRDTVENYIASILLSLRTPFLARDYVRIDEHEGNVARLTSRATVLVSLDGNHIRIPNAIVYKAVIVNYTREPRRRFSFTVGVDTDLDLEEAQAVAIDTVHVVPGVLAEPPARALVAELGDSNVSLEVQAWIDQRESDLPKVRSAAVRRVKQAFDDAGIVMPEPIYRVNIGGVGARALGALAGVEVAGGLGDAAGAAGAGDGGGPPSGDVGAAMPDGAGERVPRPTPGQAPGEEAERDEGGASSEGGRVDRERRAARLAGRADGIEDTSVDRSIEVTLEREIEHSGSQNLLDDGLPRE